MRIREDKLLHLLQAKRSEDPEGFRKYLPKVEQLLCDLLDSPPKTRRTFSAVDGQPSPYKVIWERRVLGGSSPKAGPRSMIKPRPDIEGATDVSLRHDDYLTEIDPHGQDKHLWPR